MHTIRILLTFVIAMILTSSCGKNRNDGIILSESRMVDVLYDYQLALALAGEGNVDGKQAEREYQYIEALYAKHHITSQQFDLSLAHYARDPKKLIAITECVSERLTQDLNADTEKQAPSTANAAKHAGDTITFLRHDKGYILNANESNHYTIDVPHPNFKDIRSVQLEFESQYLYREGTRNVVVVSSLQCAGDSTIRRTHNVHDYEPRHRIIVEIPKNVKATDIKFDVYQSSMWQSYPQIFLMYNVKVCGIK